MANGSETPALGKRARMKMERPQEILAAALGEFFAKGYAAARVEDIAQKVGVTKGTVYFYFESKENLLAQTVRAFSPTLSDLDSGFDPALPAKPQLARYVASLFDYIAKTPTSRQVFHLLIAEGRHFPDLVDLYYQTSLTHSLEQIRAMLDAGAARGEFKAKSQHMAELLLAPAMMANIWISVFADRRPLELGHYAGYQTFLIEALTEG